MMVPLARQRQPKQRRVPRPPVLKISSRQPTDIAAEALIDEKSARSWVATQGTEAAFALAAMEAAKLIFDHAETLRNLRAEYQTLTERFRTTFTTTRELFDAGRVAIRLLAISGAGGPSIPLRRVASSAPVESERLFVEWTRCSTTRAAEATTSMALFRTMESLLMSLYRRQLEQSRVLAWGGVKLKTDGPFRREQLARATLDHALDVVQLPKLPLIAVPVVGVAAGISHATGPKPLQTLRDELEHRADQWRKKPTLLRRRRSLQGRLIFTGE